MNNDKNSSNSIGPGSIVHVEFLLREKDLYLHVGATQPPYEVVAATRQVLIRTDGTTADGVVDVNVVGTIDPRVFVVVGSFVPDNDKTRAVKLGKVISISPPEKDE